MNETLKPFGFSSNLSKNEVSQRLTKVLQSLKFSIVETDFNRPWGGYCKVADQDKGLFLATYFGGTQLPISVHTAATISPKIIVVEAGQMPSWQVHKRRDEIWRVIDGPIGIYLSPTDIQPQKFQVYKDGEIINIPVGTRHRPVGLEQRAFFAELWIHTDPTNPSDEADIRRINDAYHRD